VPSGKKSRELRRTQAKTPPPVQSKGTARGRRASPRALAIGGGAVAVLAIVVVLAIVLSGGKHSGLPKNAQAVGNLQSALPGAAQAASMLEGIPQTGNKLGWQSAPVTLTEFIDLQCPICQEFETQVFPDIVQKYVRKKEVKVVVEPWAFIGNDSFRGQAVMLAAERQNKAFNFAAVLYANQGTENTGWLTDDMLYNIAVSVPGMQIRPLFAARSSSSVKNAAAKVDSDAQANKVDETPTLFVNRAGQKLEQVPMTSGLDEPTLVKYLNQELAGT